MEFSNLVSKVLRLCVGTEIFASRKWHWFWLVNSTVLLLSVGAVSAPCFKIKLYVW